MLRRLVRQSVRLTPSTTRQFAIASSSPSRGFAMVTTPVREAFEVEGISALGGSILEPQDVTWLARNCEEDANQMAELPHLRKMAQLCDEYKLGTPFKPEYTDIDHDTWRKMYAHLRPLWEAHAGPEWMANMDALNAELSLADGIPAMHDASAFVQRRTGFQLMPAVHLIKARSFLAALSMRCFYICAPIRPAAKMHMSEWPDVVHDILGHVPLLADPHSADMSQAIGLMSLHATEAEMQKLTMFYWHLVEMAVSRKHPGAELKISGAALLSSTAESAHVVSAEANVMPYSHEVAFGTTYEPIVTGFQTAYLSTTSLEEACEVVLDHIKDGNFKRTPEQMAVINHLSAKYSQPEAKPTAKASATSTHTATKRATQSSRMTHTSTSTLP